MAEEKWRVQALPLSDIVPRWSKHNSRGEAFDKARTFLGTDGWHHVQVRDPNGNVAWDVLNEPEPSPQAPASTAPVSGEASADAGPHDGNCAECGERVVTGGAHYSAACGCVWHVRCWENADSDAGPIQESKFVPYAPASPNSAEVGPESARVGAEDVRKLTSASNGLRVVADWIDSEAKRNPARWSLLNEVQRDLRAWATVLTRVLDALSTRATTPTEQGAEQTRVEVFYDLLDELERVANPNDPSEAMDREGWEIRWKEAAISARATTTQAEGTRGDGGEG